MEKVYTITKEHTMNDSCMRLGVVYFFTELEAVHASRALNVYRLPGLLGFANPFFSSFS